MNHIFRALRPALLLFLLVVALPLVTAPVSGQQNPVASLDPLQGLVQYRPAGAVETAWQTLTTIQLVEQGDWVRTDGMGMAVLTFFEGVQSEILPDSQVQIGQFEVDPTANTFQVTLEVSVGDLHNQVNQVLDPNSRYEVHTPSAVIAVRGTDYWVTATWLKDTLTNTLRGTVQVTGVVPETGAPGNSTLVNENQSVATQPTGALGAVGPLQNIPVYPPRAPLAPATCGNAICEPGEASICAVDCQTFPACGNAICEANLGEGPVTCAADCVPVSWLDEGATVTGSTGIPCTVQTPHGDVAMRVGPGFNRGVRDYLTPNQVFPVLGNSTANDGSLWWQIEVVNVPQAWVLQSDVTSSGDCNVGQVAPPPIVLPPAPQPVAPQPDQPVAPEIPDQPVSISFYAVPTTIMSGQCATIYWDVEGIKEVYYEEMGVTGHGSHQECPYEDQTYTLRVVLKDGTTTYRYVRILVSYVTG